MKMALSRTTVLMVIAAFLMSTAPHLLAMPAWLAVFIPAAAAWRMASMRFEWRPPGRLFRIGVTFMGLALVIIAYGTLWGRRAATALLCVMLASKLLEMYRFRDARLVAALSFFLVATQFLFSQRLELVIWLVLTCWLATAALMRIQRDEDAGEMALETDRQLIRRSLRDSIALLAMAAPFALVLFVFFPRLASPLWGLPENALDGRTGLSDEMAPGQIASLYADDSPAFRVTFDGARPDRSEMYWRGPVLWRFDGVTWRRMFYSERSPEATPRPTARAWRYTVQLEPNERNWLFSLDYPASWPTDTRLTGDFELVRDEPVTTLMRYDMISDPSFIDSPTLPETLRRIALSLPEGSNPRTREHARQLRAEYPDDRRLIEAVLRWFNEGEFYYSLQTDPLGRNGADEFLFDLRTGFCEYYASAFAILMRHAGIPARIVTGYQGGYWQTLDQYLLVRNSDAHAWVEVWLAGEGWVRVDPTAAVSPARILSGPRSALPIGVRWLDAEWVYELRNQYDRLQNLWNRWILGYNADRQQSILRRLGLQAIGMVGQAALMIGAAALLLPLVWWLRALRGSAPERDPVQRAWARVERRMRKLGAPRRTGETVQEWAARVESGGFEDERFAELARHYARLRYGPASTDAGIAGFVRECRQWKAGPLRSARPAQA